MHSVYCLEYHLKHKKYSVSSMRSHLKTVLKSGYLILFPVSLESNCIADYFATQSKLLSQMQTTSKSTKNWKRNSRSMSRKSTGKNVYMKAYMQNVRSE